MSTPAIQGSDWVTTLAHSLQLQSSQVQAVIDRLDNGDSATFLARYSQPAIGRISPDRMDMIANAHTERRQIEALKRRARGHLQRTNRLDREVAEELELAQSSTAIAALLARHRKVRPATLADRAIVAGLSALGEALWQADGRDPADATARFLSQEPSVTLEPTAAWSGGDDLVVERLVDQRDIRQLLLKRLREEAEIRLPRSRWQRLKTVKPHLVLDLSRRVAGGEMEFELRIDEAATQRYRDLLVAAFPEIPTEIDDSGWVPWRLGMAKRAWSRRLKPLLFNQVLGQARQRAETAAIERFESNLRDRLLAPPAGAKVIMGLDLGLKNGLKVAVIGPTGEVLDTVALSHLGDNASERCSAALIELIRQHGVELIAAGNGKGAGACAAVLRKVARGIGPDMVPILPINEAGASMYSGSELATRELPDLPQSLRSAVSIARRLADPLAELVKIDPAFLGLGQYQNEINQVVLGRALERVVADCVSRVGVDVNTASAPLLARVPGLTEYTAQQIIAAREGTGPLQTLEKLLDVPGIGPKVFAQAAGFLRIANGDEPLDATALHPSLYSTARQMAKAAGISVGQLIEEEINADRMKGSCAELDPDDVESVLEQFAADQANRRSPFEAPVAPAAGRCEKLEVGQRLEGQVTNVTDFGAFVDLGFDRHGLVHVSKLAPGFVRDPGAVVSPGQTVQVTLIGMADGKLSLSMVEATDSGALEQQRKSQTSQRAVPSRPQKSKSPRNNAMADALANAMKKGR